MRNATLAVLGVARALLGLYQTLVLLYLGYVFLFVGDWARMVSGFIWFLFTCFLQLAILGLAALLTARDPQ